MSGMKGSGTRFFKRLDQRLPVSFLVGLIIGLFAGLFISFLGSFLSGFIGSLVRCLARGFLGLVVHDLFRLLECLLALFLGDAFLGLVDPFLVLLCQCREKTRRVAILGIVKTIAADEMRFVLDDTDHINAVHQPVQD